MDLGQNVQAKFNEKQNEVRIAIMNVIIDNKRPFHMKQDGYEALKGISLSGKDEFEDILDVLHSRDGFSADEEGNINFIYPVSALPTAHRVTLADGREFSAMCAIDAIGATFTFHEDTQIHSSCCVCGNDVYVEMKNGECAKHRPEGLYALSFCLEEITNWAGSC